jgi:hypothetical protein
MILLVYRRKTLSGKTVTIDEKHLIMDKRLI